MVHNNTIWQCNSDVHLFSKVPLESTHNNRLGRIKKAQISFGVPVKSQKMTAGWKNRANNLKGGTGAKGWSVLITRSKSDARSGPSEAVSVFCGDPVHGKHKHLFLCCFAFKLNLRWCRWRVENARDSVEDPLCAIHHWLLQLYTEKPVNQSDFAL